MTATLDDLIALEAECSAPDQVNGVAHPTDGPTRLKPMQGLSHLPRVSLFGRDAILAKAREPVDYAWQDIAVRGTITMIAGGPGEGKTTLLFLLLIARATKGEPVTVLSRTVFPAPDGRWIILVEGEHGEGSACRKLERTCVVLNVHDIALDRIIVIARKAVHIGSPEWSDITKLVAAGLVSDIAIDTVARVAPADGNDERAQVAIFDLVAQTIDAAPSDETKPLVWAVGHTRKNNTGGDVADVSGSTQRTGQADSVLLVKGEKINGRTVSSTVTFAKLREDPDDYPLPVTFAIAPNELGVRALHVSDVRPDTDEPLEGRVLNQLALGPKTKTGLATALTRSKADVDAALTTLFEARRIRTCEVTVGGRRRKAFQLSRNGLGARDEHGTRGHGTMGGTEHGTEIEAEHEPS